MNLLSSNHALLLVITSGVAAVMVRLGLRARLLDRPPRRCRACGRELAGGRCHHCEP